MLVSMFMLMLVLLCALMSEGTTHACAHARQPKHPPKTGTFRRACAVPRPVWLLDPFNLPLAPNPSKTASKASPRGNSLSGIAGHSRVMPKATLQWLYLVINRVHLCGRPCNLGGLENKWMILDNFGICKIYGVPTSWNLTKKCSKSSIFFAETIAEKRYKYLCLCHFVALSIATCRAWIC